MRERGAEIDWLFADIVLPGLVTGWIVGAEFHLNHPLKPIIYASAFKQDVSRKAWGSIFLEKPIKPADVVRLFQTLSLRHQQDRRERPVPTCRVTSPPARP